jgi:3',5'-cyclic-AMP phosphodiesterase
MKRVTRLIQLTDMHIYAEPGGRFGGMDTRKSFERVLEHLHRLDAAYDGLMLTGDLAMDGSRGAYRYLRQMLAEENVPVLCLPGNHDQPRTLAASGLSTTGPAPQAYVLGDWRLVLLNTQVDDCAHGEIESAQIDWLSGLLGSTHAGYDAVFLHHHPVSIGSPWMDAMGLRGADALWSAISAHPTVRLVVFGHVHQNVDRYLAGVRVLGTPSTCVQFMPRATHYAADARAPGYRIIELDDRGQVSSSIVRVPMTTA